MKQEVYIERYDKKQVIDAFSTLVEEELMLLNSTDAILNNSKIDELLNNIVSDILVGEEYIKSISITFVDNEDYFMCTLIISKTNFFMRNILRKDFKVTVYDWKENNVLLKFGKEE